MITETKRSPHPMMLAAGIALIVFCAVGISAIMGWIPSSMGRNADLPVSALDMPPAATEKSSRATPVRVASTAKAACASCGVVQSVRAIETRGTGSGVGAVGGAVVGGLLGNQVGGGHGKEAMTVVGALGGALAGNQIEKTVNSTTSYEIVVRMENGSDQIIHESNSSAWRSGDRVKVVNGAIHSA